MTDGVLHEYKEKPGACSECGNSPVNHAEAYIADTLTVWSTEFATRPQSKIISALRALADGLYDFLEPYFFAVVAALPITRFAHDPTRAKTYRSQVVWEEAAKRGIRMEQMVLFGRYTDIYRAHIRDRWHYFISIPVPPELERETAQWIDDKYLLKRGLSEAGIPVPKIYSVTSLSDARRAHAEIGEAVVKPRAGSRGRHTSVRVQTDEDLARAYRSAKQLGRFVVIEKYLSGGVSRATVVGGTLAGFFHAHPPEVTGDGASTVAELIAQKNATKPDRVQDIVLTNEHRAFLARCGYSEDSVLPVGTTIALSHRTGRLFGGHTREMLGSEHPKLRAYVEQAAGVLRVPVVGFDLIIPDPARDPDEQEWGIIEANGLPYIDLHYLPLHGTPSPVAKSVWDLWEQT